MSTGSTERLVKYMLTVEVSPDAEQQQKRFKEFMKLTQKEVDQAVKESADNRVEAEKTAADRITEMQEQQLRVLEDINRQSTTLVDMKLAEQQRAEEEAAKAREEREKDSLRRIQDQYKKHVETVTRSAKELTDGYLQATEGFITLAQGAASVGLLAEEDTEKLLRMIVTIRGVADVAKGGIELYRGISAAVEAYRASVLAAVAAEEMLNAARAKGAGASAGGAAASFFGGAASSAAGAGGLTTAIGGLSSAVLGLPGAIAAAVASVTFATAQAAQSFNIGGTADAMADAGWYDPNSMPGWITANRDAMSLTSWAYGTNYDTMRAQDAALQSQRTTERRIAESERERRERGMISQNVNADHQSKFDLRMQALEMRRQREMTVDDLHGGATSDSVLERLSRAQAMLQTANYERSVADAVTHGTAGREGDISRAYQIQVYALKEVVELRKQAFALQKKEGKEALESTQKETQELERQLEIKERELERVETQYMSARVRFGQLNEAEQHTAISLMKKAQSGETLNREQTNILRSVGTKSAIELANKFDLERSDNAKFDPVFGTVEKPNIQQMIQDKLKLQLELAKKQEIEISFKNDLEAIKSMAQQVADIVVPQMKEMEVIQRQEMENAINAKGSRDNSKFSAGPRTGS